jgi:hypothetical protein
VDLDGDGTVDILSGSYSRMEQTMAGLFHVLHGNKDGTFRKAEVVKGADGEPLIIPTTTDDEDTERICTRPFAVDWDGDGKLDLVVGNFAGSFYWFQGEGGGKFAPRPERLKAGSDFLKIGDAHSDPMVVDWDGDGDLDILSGSNDGGVWLAENTAGKGQMPILKQFRRIIKASAEPPSDQPYRDKDVREPGRMSRIWVADFNGDGKLDILLGDSVTLVTPADGLSDAEMAKRLKEWNKEMEKLQKSIEAKQDGKDKAELQISEETSKKFQALYEQRAEFMKEERTGFVWLYLRK